MRNVAFVVASILGGLVVGACGGGDEKAPPVTPAVVPSAAEPAPAPSAAAPKKEEPKLSAAELQQKTTKSVYEAMSARDAKKLAALYADSAVVKIAGAPADVTGREAIAGSFQKLFDAFGEYKAAPARIFTKGDVTIVEWAFNGKHTGNLWGMKATEKPVGAMGVDVFWFNPDGQIKEHHVFYDGTTILSQIGVSTQKARPIPVLPTSAQTFAAGGPDEQKNIETTKAMNGAIEAKKEADFLAPMADNVEYDDLSQPQASKGKAEAKKFFKEVTGAFPDSKFTTTNSWGVGDYVIAEVQWTGTHKGAFFGIPATKKSINTKNLDIVQFKDGKYAHAWSYSNSTEFAQQLGLVPSPGDKKPADKAPATGDKKAEKPAEKAPAAPKK